MRQRREDVAVCSEGVRHLHDEVEAVNSDIASLEAAWASMQDGGEEEVAWLKFRLILCSAECDPSVTRV